jgi:hypothetical protein
MATKKTAAGTAAAHTIKLSVPLAGADGPIEQLTLRRPILADHIAAEQTPAGTARSVALWATLAGVPVKAMEKLKTRDGRQVNKWLTTDALHLDEPPPPMKVDGDLATFGLIVPVAGIDSITLREPDLAMAIAVERLNYKNEHETLGAMIAVLSGRLIPDVHQLDMRDVNRMGDWLAPFVVESISTDESPGEP